MGSYKKSVITNAGNALIARVLAGEVTMEFSRGVISSYVYPDGTDFNKLESLENIQMAVVPSNIRTISDTFVGVRTIFGNRNVTEPYLIQNVGIYATDGTTEILFSVSQATDPDQMPVYSGVESSFIYDIQVSVERAKELTITVNQAGTVTILDMMKLDEEKVDASGGDISDTIADIMDPAADDKYPTWSKGTIKSILGIAKRWLASLKDDLDRTQATVDLSIPASGWSSAAPYTQTVAAAGVTADDVPVIGILIASGTAAAAVKTQKKAWACVDRAVTGAGTITFYCYNKKPAVDFTARMKGVG